MGFVEIIITIVGKLLDAFFGITFANISILAAKFFSSTEIVRNYKWLPWVVLALLIGSIIIMRSPSNEDQQSN